MKAPTLNLPETVENKSFKKYPTLYQPFLAPLKGDPGTLPRAPVLGRASRPTGLGAMMGTRARSLGQILYIYGHKYMYVVCKVCMMEVAVYAFCKQMLHT